MHEVHARLIGRAAQPRLSTRGAAADGGCRWLSVGVSKTVLGVIHANSKPKASFSMAHYHKPLAAAVALNTGIFVVGAVAGWQAHSLSLLMESVHNFSDELALVLLYLAFILSGGVSRHLVRAANFFNSVGLIAVSALLIWQAIDHLLHPEAVSGLFPLAVGLGAAAANGCAHHPDGFFHLRSFGLVDDSALGDRVHRSRGDHFT